MRSVVTLEAEASAANQERVSRRAVALVGAIVVVHVAVGADAELSIRASDEEMLSIPSCREGRVFLGCGRWLCLVDAARFNRGVGLNHNGVYQMDAIGGVAADGLRSGHCDGEGAG